VQTKQQIQALLTQINTHPRHQFGQNFLIDGNLLRLVAAAGNVGADDWIIEIGPGTGSLTEELLAGGCHVTAVEIDRDLAGLLRQRLGHKANFTLIEGDALAGKHAINAQLLSLMGTARAARKPVKLVANLPYNIASPLVIELLIAGAELLAFTVQKEVAQRLKAAAGSEHFGPLSVMAQLLAEVELLRTLPPQAFWPMPKVDSGLVRMTRRDQLGTRAADFSRFVHAVFSYRRKMLRKALIEAEVREEVVDAALVATKLSPRSRPEEIGAGEWLGLYEAIKKGG
jgi:16S rRNA (adenine1518-N6/adenine1519-N6)-dimethyltransferase